MCSDRDYGRIRRSTVSGYIHCSLFVTQVKRFVDFAGTRKCAHQNRMRTYAVS